MSGWRKNYLVWDKKANKAMSKKITDLEASRIARRLNSLAGNEECCESIYAYNSKTKQEGK